MTKEELIKNQFPNDEFLQSSVLQIVDKCVADLEKRISVLLSCKNCPDNKGGLICQKEYEDKCLAQKIQYIKELKEENAELKEQTKKMKCCGNCKHRDDMTSYCEKHKKEIYIFMVDCCCNDWELFH